MAELSTLGLAIQTAWLALTPLQRTAFVTALNGELTFPAETFADAGDVRDALAALTGTNRLPLASVVNAGPVPIRATAANFTNGTAFPAGQTTLLLGQTGFETDTQKWKMGDGTTVWASLAYTAGSTGTGTWPPSGTPAALTTANLVAFTTAVQTAIDASVATAVADALAASLAAAAAVELAETKASLTGAVPIREATALEIREGTVNPWIFMSPETSALADKVVTMDDHAGGNLVIDGLAGKRQFRRILLATTVTGLDSPILGKYEQFFLNSTGSSIVVTFAGALLVSGTNTRTLTAGQMLAFSITKWTDQLTSTVYSSCVIGDTAGVAPLVAPSFTGAAGASGHLLPLPATSGQTLTVTPTYIGTPAPTVSVDWWKWNNDTLAGQTALTLTRAANGGGRYEVQVKLVNSEAPSGVTRIYRTYQGPIQPDLIGDTIVRNALTSGGLVATDLVIPGADYGLGVPIAGDLAWIVANQQSDVDDPFPDGFTKISGSVGRLDAASGANYRAQMATKILDSTDITAGLFSMLIRANSSASLHILRGAETIDWDSTVRTRNPAALPINTQNTVALSVRTPASASLAAAIVFSNDYTNKSMLAALTGWTGGGTLAGVPSGVGKYGHRVLWRLVQGGVALTAGTITTGGGAADGTLMTTTAFFTG